MPEKEVLKINQFLGRVIMGDCLEVMKQIPDNSVDSIITDPPYGLSNHKPEKIAEVLKEWLSGNDSLVLDGKGFMGKEWDAFVPPPAIWKECYRVLKPGATMLIFAGTRSVDLMMISIRLAGFEIKDTVEYIYGSGFPKAYDISKAIDKKPKADYVKEWKKWLSEQIDNCGKSKKQINDECGFTATSYTKTDNKDYWSSNLPKNGKWKIMKKVIGITTNEYDWVEQENCEIRGYIEPTGGLAGGSGNTVGCFTGKQLSNNAIDERAKQWQGYKSHGLKPAHEPIIMAIKPNDGSCAENALKWGVAGLNIDGGRIGTRCYKLKEDVDKKIINLIKKYL